MAFRGAKRLCPRVSYSISAVINDIINFVYILNTYKTYGIIIVKFDDDKLLWSLFTHAPIIDQC